MRNPCCPKMSLLIRKYKKYRFLRYSRFNPVIVTQLFSCLYLTSNYKVAYNTSMNWDKDAIFKALSDPNRRVILDELSERDELTLYDLTTRLIMKHNLTITRQAIAKHLSALEAAGLVMSKRNGKFRVLIFNREPLKDLLKGWVE